MQTNKMLTGMVKPDIKDNSFLLSVFDLEQRRYVRGEMRFPTMPRAKAHLIKIKNKRNESKKLNKLWVTLPGL